MLFPGHFPGEISRKCFKGTRYRSRFRDFKTDITQGRTLLRISVNNKQSMLSSDVDSLFVCSESCFCTFGRIDWVGWRLVEKMGGAGLQEGHRGSPISRAK